jgi:hypothetical protein
LPFYGQELLFLQNVCSPVSKQSTYSENVTALYIVMKKFNAEITFAYAQILNGLNGGKYIPLELNDRRLTYTIPVEINLKSMPKTNEMVMLLDDSQIITVFEEESGDLFESLEDVRSAFTFDVHRHRGWIDRTSVKKIYHPHMFWVKLTQDQGQMSSAQAVAQRGFVLCQLARFGVIDRLRVILKQ